MARSRDGDNTEEQLDWLGPAEVRETLDRAGALVRLDALVGADLRPLADEYGVTVWRAGRRNKGWAGQVVERYLGLPANASPEADFGNWELKVVPLRVDRHGEVWPKETMAIAMTSAAELEAEDFEDSHVLAKLGRLVVVARVYIDATESCSPLYGAAAFDLDDPELYDQIREDYEDARWTVRQDGLHALDGHVGRLIQPRPKGPGRGSTTMGFYAKKSLVAYMLGMGERPV